MCRFCVLYQWSLWYGLESFNHSYIGFPQIDNGRYGGIYIGPVNGNKHAATRIFGTFMDCGANESSVPPGAVAVTTGDIAAGSNIITNVAGLAGIAVGDPINSPKLAVNTAVVGLASSSNRITLSKTATISQTGASLGRCAGGGCLLLRPPTRGRDCRTGRFPIIFGGIQQASWQ